jgi:hypothetical protein
MILVAAEVVVAEVVAAEAVASACFSILLCFRQIGIPDC